MNGPTAAFKKLKDDAARNAKHDAERRASAQAHRQRSELVQAAIDATVEWEVLSRTYERRKEQPSLGLKLGMLIVTKGWSIQSIITQWDADGDQSVDKDEFRTHVKSLCAQYSTFEIDKLFDSLDADGGGALDLREVAEALRNFREEAKGGKDVLRSMAKRVFDKAREAKAAQVAMREALEAERVAIAEVAEREQLVAEEKAAAAAQAKAERAAAAEEKKAREAEEKAAFAARAEAKRRQGK